jgi:7-keto-8-aminopelargonate synthetase-like enzyme
VSVTSPVSVLDAEYVIVVTVGVALGEGDTERLGVTDARDGVRDGVRTRTFTTTVPVLGATGAKVAVVIHHHHHHHRHHVLPLREIRPAEVVEVVERSDDHGEGIVG